MKNVVSTFFRLVVLSAKCAWLGRKSADKKAWLVLSFRDIDADLFFEMTDRLSSYADAHPGFEVE